MRLSGRSVRERVTRVLVLHKKDRSSNQLADPSCSKILTRVAAVMALPSPAPRFRGAGGGIPVPRAGADLDRNGASVSSLDRPVCPARNELPSPIRDERAKSVGKEVHLSH